MIIKNLADMANKTLVAQFSNAIAWEKCDMLLRLNYDSQKKQTAIINGDTSSKEEVELAEKRLEKLHKEEEELILQQAECQDDYDRVMAEVSSAHNEFSSNSPEVLRNILRLSCCDDNANFFKLAIITDETFASFYDAMVSLHDMESAEIAENGLRQYSPQAMKQAESLEVEIQGLIKSLFSISIENNFTKKINVKFNKTDMNCLHETFVSGLAVSVSKSKHGNSSNGVEFRYAIEKINKKDGTVEYKGARFKETIAKLAFNKLFG